MSLLDRLLRRSPAPPPAPDPAPPVDTQPHYADESLMRSANVAPHTPASAGRATDVAGAGARTVVAGQYQLGIANYVTDAKKLRLWAETCPPVRNAIKVRKERLVTAEWDIVAVDPEKPRNEALRLQLIDLFSRPNPQNDSFRATLGMIVEDICVLDEGVLEKELAVNGQVLALWPIDANKLGFNSRWNGEPDDYRYIYKPSAYGPAIGIRNDEMIVMQETQVTYRLTGLSPVQWLAKTIESCYVSEEFQLSAARNIPPSGIMFVPGASDQKQIGQLKTRYETEVAGKKAIFFVGYGSDDEGKPSFTPFMYNAQTSQWESWQEFLWRTVAIAFGLSPLDLGMERDVNRNTGETMQQNTADTGLIPLLKHIKGYFDREVIATFPGASTANLQFMFLALSDTDAQAAADLSGKLTANTPQITINEARHLNGFEPIEGGDVIVSVAGGSLVPILGPDADKLRQDVQEHQQGMNPPPPEPAKGEGAKDSKSALRRLSPDELTVLRLAGDVLDYYRDTTVGYLFEAMRCYLALSPAAGERRLTLALAYATNRMQPPDLIAITQRAATVAHAAAIARYGVSGGFNPADPSLQRLLRRSAHQAGTAAHSALVRSLVETIPTVAALPDADALEALELAELRQRGAHAHAVARAALAEWGALIDEQIRLRHGIEIAA